MNYDSSKHVIIADDHPIFRKGLREVIDSTGQWQVIAEAESGKTVVEHYINYAPDVVILDISMGQVNGFEAAKKILHHDPNARCVMMTMYRETAFCQRALAIGVRGYLLKDDASDDIVSCLNSVIQGEIFISNSLGENVYLPEKDNTAKPELVLSETEMRILTAIAELKTNKEIAAEFDISVRTVQNHRHNINSKLNLSGRQVLLQFAVKWLESTVDEALPD